MQIVLKSKKDDKGIITCTFKPPRQETRYRSIRGGICWPGSGSLGYFCILGQIYDPEIEQKKLYQHSDELSETLEFIFEHQGHTPSLKDFNNSIFDATKRLHCEKHYAEMPVNNTSYIDAFKTNYAGYVDSLRKDGGSLDLSLVQARYSDDFLYGTFLINDFRKQGRFEIPEDSIAYKQITSITEDDMVNKPENRFFAINALRHVIVGFYLDDPINDISPGFKPRRKWRQKSPR